MAEDPYFVVRDELNQSLKTVENLYEKWKRIGDKIDAIRLSQNPGASSSLMSDYKWTTNEIKNNIKSMEWDVKDLEDTIKVVESNPQKFQHLSAAEISNRKGFVRDLKAKLAGIRDAVNTERTAEKAGLPKKGKETASSLPATQQQQPSNNFGNGGVAGMQQQMVKDNCDYQLKLIHRIVDMQQQDEQLDVVLGTIGVIKEQSRVIGNELDDQAVLLSNLESQVDQTQSKLDSTLGRLNKVIKSASKSPSTVCIIFLVIVLIILLLYLVM